jgi:hypothetical protein
MPGRKVKHPTSEQAMLAEVAKMKRDRETVAGFLAVVNPETRAALEIIAKHSRANSVEHLAVMLLQQKVIQARALESRKVVRKAQIPDSAVRRFFDPVKAAILKADDYTKWILLDGATGSVTPVEVYPGERPKGSWAVDIRNRGEITDTAGMITDDSIRAFLMGWATPAPELLGGPRP